MSYIHTLVSVFLLESLKNTLYNKVVAIKVRETGMIFIKIGANTWIWVSPFTTKHADLVPKVKQMGFDVIEIAAEDWDLIDITQIRNMLMRFHLDVTVCGAFGPTRDLISDEEGIRANAYQYIEQSIVKTAALGATIFAGPMYSAVGKARLVDAEQKKIETERFVSAMHKLTRLAAASGVTLCVEPLNRFETDFVNITEQAVYLVDLVNHPNIGIHLDTFHMGIEEKNMGDAIRLAAHRLKHFHSCENHRGAPGTGLVPWESVRVALREINYQGCMVIESFTPGVLEIARAAAIWRPLARSQDQLAEDGLHFLREIFG